MITKIVIFNTETIAPSLVQDFLNQDEHIVFSFRCFPGAIMVATSLSANDLGELLESKLSKKGLKEFIVTEIEPKAFWGKVPIRAWHMIANPDDPVMPPRILAEAAFWLAERGNRSINAVARKTKANQYELLLFEEDVNVEPVILSEDDLLEIEKQFPEAFARGKAFQAKANKRLPST